MEQAAALAELLEAVRSCMPELSIGMFSGYGVRELERTQALWGRVKATLDFGVFGRFNHHQPADQPLIASRNQRLILFCGGHTLADFEPPMVEFTIDDCGFTQITGFPLRGDIAGSISINNIQ